MSRPVKITIDLSAIRANCALAQALAPNSKTVAVVKADAYGHDAVKVAQALEPQVEMLTVSCLAEAKTLRDAGLTKPILLLEGCFDATELALAEQYQCQLIIHKASQVNDLLNYKSDHTFVVWLKIDSGMHRLGILPDEVESIYQRLADASNVKDVVLTTHLSSADDLQSEQTYTQLECFNNCITPILASSSNKLEKSVANSAGVLAWPQTKFDWNRPGIMLYGLSPFTHPQNSAKSLIPAMTFQSEIIAIRQIEVGESVGYGNTWTARRRSKIATIAVGYGDGYPRAARSGTPVLINNQRAPLVGRVSMDLISVDVTDLTDTQIGDTAILWGKELSANDIAGYAGTIGYELVTRMPKRVKRYFVE